MGMMENFAFLSNPVLQRFLRRAGCISAVSAGMRRNGRGSHTSMYAPLLGNRSLRCSTSCIRAVVGNAAPCLEQKFLFSRSS